MDLARRPQDGEERGALASISYVADVLITLQEEEPGEQTSSWTVCPLLCPSSGHGGHSEVIDQ